MDNFGDCALYHKSTVSLLDQENIYIFLGYCNIYSNWIEKYNTDSTQTFALASKEIYGPGTGKC